MRLKVSVPVLSVHRTVAAPSVSMVAGRRVRTRRRDRRHAPITVKTTSTSGSSSGSIAMLSAMPASSASSHRPVINPWIATASALSPRPAIAKIATQRRVSASRPARAGTIFCSVVLMRPSCVRAPVAVTTAMPAPLTSRLPEYRLGRSSPPAAPCAGSADPSGRLRTGTDSPVSSDSSALTSSPATSSASAAMRSPSFTTSRSPTTTSRPAMRWRVPSRTTRACGALRSRSFASMRLERSRWITAIDTDSVAKITSTAASRGSPIRA